MNVVVDSSRSIALKVKGGQFLNGIAGFACSCGFGFIAEGRRCPFPAAGGLLCGGRLGAASTATQQAAQALQKILEPPAKTCRGLSAGQAGCDVSSCQKRREPGPAASGLSLDCWRATEQNEKGARAASPFPTV